MRCIAPVVMRFLGYGVTMDDNARRYVDAITALPALREWRAAGGNRTRTHRSHDGLGKA